MNQEIEQKRIEAVSTIKRLGGCPVTTLARLSRLAPSEVSLMLRFEPSTSPARVLALVKTIDRIASIVDFLGFRPDMTPNNVVSFAKLLRRFEAARAASDSECEIIEHFFARETARPASSQAA